MSILDYDWYLIWEYREPLLDGFWVAAQVSIVALFLAIGVGLVVALLRMTSGVFSWLALIYINVLRGVPPLVSVVWVYFGLAVVVDIKFSVFQAGVIALTLLYSAFLAEIFRASLTSVPSGHREAGQALGLRGSRIFFSIIVPQATKTALPNVGNIYIGMLKDTSTFTIIGLLEVVRVTQNLVSSTFQPFVFYTAAALIYVGAAFVIDLIFRMLESSYTRPPKGPIMLAIRGRSRRKIGRLISKTNASHDADLLGAT